MEGKKWNLVCQQKENIKGHTHTQRNTKKKDFLLEKGQ